jgi:CRISPR-associated protein Cas4
MSVFSEQYWLAWKIDIFNRKTWELTERKTKIFIDDKWKEKIYLWQRYQLWGQMFCLEEMWYHVSQIFIYSVKTNKKYRIYRPNTMQLLWFENILEKYRKFDLLQKNWKQNTKKCIKCIYRELCDYYIGEIYPQLKLFETLPYSSSLEKKE